MQKKHPNRNIPTLRDRVLKVLEKQPYHKRDIAKLLGLTGEEKQDLKEVLRDLLEQRLVVKDSRFYRLPAALPSVLAMRLSLDEDGILIGIPLDDRLPQKPVKISSKDQAFKGGESVLVRMISDHTARILKRLERKEESFLGILVQKEGFFAIKPLHKAVYDKLYRLDHIPEQVADKVRPNILVKCIALRSKRYEDVARILEVYEEINDPRGFSKIAIADYNLPLEFAEDVEKEAEFFPDITKYDDLTALPFLTIDPSDAKDHDDAVYVEKRNECFDVYVAIADVAAFVKPNSKLDKEALKRGNSTYFPDGVVPMLPHALSSNACSLKANLERLALVTKIRIDAQGQMGEKSFHRARIKVVENMSYQDAEKHFENGFHDPSPAISSLKTLYQAFSALEHERRIRAPLHITTTEHKIRFLENGEISLETPPRLKAHQVIEDMMILANRCVAEFLSEHKFAKMNRIHEPPEALRVDALRDILKTVGLTLPLGKHLKPKDFNVVLDAVEDQPEEALVSEMALRAQTQAFYGSDNAGHFGLNLKQYVHFTSPIRRYADIVNHRLLLQVLGFEDGEVYSPQVLNRIGAEISDCERRSQNAERDTLNRLRTHMLMDKVGETFLGLISGFSKAGVFVRLKENGAEGFMSLRDLRPFGFRLNDKLSILYGLNGTHYRLGDIISVTLTSADSLSGAVRFMPSELPEVTYPQKRKYENRRRRR